MNILELLVHYLNGAYSPEFAPERKGKEMKCLKCGCKYFKEFSRELCSQSGIIIDKGGIVNYENAGSVDIIGDSERLGFTCEECSTDYVLVKGKLVTQSF